MDVSYLDTSVLQIPLAAENEDELHNLYTSPNVIRVIKSRKMRWSVM
jgi:hypothetical protein